jgi:hypothetical protein
MTGDQTREMKFLQRFGRYRDRHVRELLSFLAEVLDVRLSLKAFMPRDGLYRVSGLGRRYDAEAIDQLLAGLGHTPAIWLAEPWRPAHRNAGRWDGSRTGDRCREAPAPRQQLARNCKPAGLGSLTYPRRTCDVAQ